MANLKTGTCSYQWVSNIRFSENLAGFVFLKHPSWDSSFCLVTDDLAPPFPKNIITLVLLNKYN